MKVLLQRVSAASVTVDEQVTGSIKQGLLLLVGIGKDDDPSHLQRIAEKIVHMRVFPDDDGRFHHSVMDVEGGLLAVPQFTLYADTSKGRRPEFFGAMPPGEATKMFDQFTAVLEKLCPGRVASGVFGAHMKVQLENDGPVTILVES